jgi:hypothetical protein
MPTQFILKLKDLGQETRRRFCSDVIDYYKNDNVDRETIPNYRISKKKVQETKPKFLSVAKGRDFYYLIEDILIKDIDTSPESIKTQLSTQQEKKQTKETFDITKSSKVLDTQVQERETSHRDHNSIFTARLDSSISTIDITSQVKKVKMFFPGRDCMNIVIPEDPNEIGSKFILKGMKPMKRSDFKKV